MIEKVFTSDYLCFELSALEARESEAEKDLDIARLRHQLMKVLYEVGNALHSNFVAGDEAKWRHPGQRESLITLSDLAKTAHKSLSEDAG
jgi:hypothetical protein